MAFFASEFVSILSSSNYQLKYNNFVLTEAIIFNLLIIVWILWFIFYQETT